MKREIISLNVLVVYLVVLTKYYHKDMMLCLALLLFLLFLHNYVLVVEVM